MIKIQKWGYLQISIETDKRDTKAYGKTVGHKCRLYAYGADALNDSLVAVAAGGGSYPFAATEVAERSINCYITDLQNPYHILNLPWNFIKFPASTPLMSLAEHTILQKNLHALQWLITLSLVAARRVFTWNLVLGRFIVMIALQIP